MNDFHVDETNKCQTVPPFHWSWNTWLYSSWNTLFSGPGFPLAVWPFQPPFSFSSANLSMLEFSGLFLDLLFSLHPLLQPQVILSILWLHLPLVGCWLSPKSLSQPGLSSEFPTLVSNGAVNASAWLPDTPLPHSFWTTRCCPLRNATVIPKQARCVLWHFGVTYPVIHPILLIVLPGYFSNPSFFSPISTTNLVLSHCNFFLLTCHLIPMLVCLKFIL